jgi:dTDP-3-amino-3,4,6-trideoxy-alpha-D-glucose transaminase
MAIRIPCADLAAEWREVGAAVEAAVLRVLRSGAYVLGPETQAFEAELAGFVGTRHAVGVGSGTEALELALLALGVGRGDEVVTTPFTFFATIEAILRVGARPVFADIERDGFHLDPAAVEAALTARTRAVIPVHLFGRCADTRRILALCAPRGIPVVEDAAQAIGASRDGLAAGAAGALGCISFYPSKNLGAAGDAGAVTTDDAALAERVRMLRFHGSRERYVHERVGTTSRLDSIQAAVLRVKLPCLRGWNAARGRLAARYAERLAGAPGIVLPGAGAGETPVWYLYTIRCRDAKPVREALDRSGVEWRHFYAMPAYRQAAVADLGIPAGACPEAERACREVISLPIYPTLADAAVDEISATIRAAAAG